MYSYLEIFEIESEELICRFPLSYADKSSEQILKVNLARHYKETLTIITVSDVVKPMITT